MTCQAFAPSVEVKDKEFAVAIWPLSLFISYHILVFQLPIDTTPVSLETKPVGWQVIGQTEIAIFEITNQYYCIFVSSA